MNNSWPSQTDSQAERIGETPSRLPQEHRCSFYPHLYESTVFYAWYFYLLWSELMTKTLIAKVL